MSRKEDPSTRYRVRIHKDREYTYASVQVPTISLKTGKKYPKTVNLGTLDDNFVFTPNAAFRVMPLEEQAKYIFPNEWDISKIKNLSFPLPKEDKQPQDGDVKPVIDDRGKINVHRNTVNNDSSVPLPSNTILDQYNNRLYGAFWLLEQISRNCGLYEDLLKTFHGSLAKVHEILSLAFYPYLSGKNYCRFS